MKEQIEPHHSGTSQKVIAIIVLIVVIILIAAFSWQTISYNLKLSQIEDYAQQAGLANVSVYAHTDRKYEITLHCDNFNKTDWKTLMTMDQNIRNLHEDIDVKYSQAQFDYRIHQSDNTIIAIDGDSKIEYNGSWGSRRRINTDEEERKQQEQSQRIQEAIDNNRDSRISTSQCCICGKQATQQIDGDYYCTEHYSDAYNWYVEKAAQKLVEGQ